MSAVVLEFIHEVRVAKEQMECIIKRDNEWIRIMQREEDELKETCEKLNKYLKVLSEKLGF